MVGTGEEEEGERFAEEGEGTGSRRRRGRMVEEMVVLEVGRVGERRVEEGVRRRRKAGVVQTYTEEGEVVAYEGREEEQKRGREEEGESHLAEEAEEAREERADHEDRGDLVVVVVVIVVVKERKRDLVERLEQVLLVVGKMQVVVLLVVLQVGLFPLFLLLLVGPCVLLLALVV